MGQIQQPLLSRHFGVHGTKDYQGGWAASLPLQWDATSSFVSSMNGYGLTNRFYRDLTNHRETYWHENVGDATSYGLESVDLFFAVTHGAYDWPWWIPPEGQHSASWSMYANSGDVKYPTWPWPTGGSQAYSEMMRLGEEDEGRGLSVFATYSCNTMNMTDTYWWQRYSPIMNGGLRIALGGHEGLAAGAEMGGIGSAFSFYLNYLNGSFFSLELAWHYGVSYADYYTPTATIATGTTRSDCWRRMNNMKWGNFDNGDYPRLTNDGSPYVGYYCIRAKT